MVSKSDKFDRLQAQEVYPYGTEALAPEVSPVFNLDPELPDALALSRLPYISPDAIEKRTGGHEHYLQHRSVRVERIIGGNYSVYGSWSGNSHKDTPEGKLSSIEHARKLASKKVYAIDNYDPIWLKPFEDADGAVWFRADHGAHRIMAAKLNSETTLVANMVEPDKGIAMDFYAGSVVREALEAHTPLSDLEQAVAMPKPWIGRISLWNLLRSAGSAGLEDRQRTRYLR